MILSFDIKYSMHPLHWSAATDYRYRNSECAWVRVYQQLFYYSSLDNQWLYTVSQKTDPFYILNISVNTELVSIIFGVQYPKEFHM